MFPRARAGGLHFSNLGSNAVTRLDVLPLPRYVSLVTVGGSQDSDLPLMDTAPVELTSQRRRRAVALIALAVLVLAAASATYLRSTMTSQVRPVGAQDSPLAQGGPVTIPYLPPSPTPSPRSAGLLRGGAITVLIEQFGGLNDQPPLGLKVSVQISDPAAISKLVRELNALPAFPGGVFSCPMDDGSYFALVFTYADGTGIDVKVEAGGCGGVYIGGSTQPVAWTLTSPTLVDTLKSLLANKPPS
jgi:hypothetical protein